MPLMGWEEKKESGGTVHVIGICGTAMANLGAMLQARGFDVRGSDAGIYPPMSEFLAARGIPVLEGYDAKHLDPPPDLVVVGNAVGRGNPEVEYVLDADLPYTSLPEVLRWEFLPGKTRIVVTGTHGKTTTASMLASSLYQLNQDPSFMIGGVPEDFDGGFRLGAGAPFVLEGDEYDTAFFDKAPKFFHYRPSILVINRLEHDHADIYPDLESILIQFRRLVNMVPSRGLVVVDGDCPHACSVASLARGSVLAVGLGESNDLRVRLPEIGSAIDEPRVLEHGEERGFMRLSVFGEHNLRNALACCGVLRHLGFPWAGILEALSRFSGVRRRMSLRGQVNGIQVYDDFAHHPTAVRLSLRGMRSRHPSSRIWAIFEPRSWTCCRNNHQEAFQSCFDAADRVILADPSRKMGIPDALRLHPEQIIESLRGQGKHAWHIPEVADIIRRVVHEAEPGDLVVIMSNGGFGGIHQKLLDALKM